MKIQGIHTEEYIQWVSELKTKIQATQIKAALSVNRELLGLYWDLGRSISEKIHKTSWGNAIVETIGNGPEKKNYPIKKDFPVPTFSQ